MQPTQEFALVVYMQGYHKDPPFRKGGKSIKERRYEKHANANAIALPFLSFTFSETRGARARRK